MCCPRSGSFEDWFQNDHPSTTFSQICEDRLLTLRYDPNPAKPMPARFSSPPGVDVQIVHTDGGLDNLVKGDLAFTTLAGNGLAALLPAADVQATPYGFRNPAQVYRAMDGALGEYLRDELRAKALYALPGGCFENGMHQITGTRPIRSAADMQGLKIRVPGSPVYQDFFKALGAQVFTMGLGATLAALKSGMVEAQDDPWDVVELFKFYEAQKYASITDHSWSGYNLLANLKDR